MYTNGLCLTCHDTNILNEALDFFKQLNKDSYVQECIALIYLKLAKLNYKEDPDSKFVNDNAHNTSTVSSASPSKIKDKTELYINSAIKALDTVENEET